MARKTQEWMIGNPNIPQKLLNKIKKTKIFFDFFVVLSLKLPISQPHAPIVRDPTQQQTPTEIIQVEDGWQQEFKI